MPRHAKLTKTARIFGDQVRRRRLALGLTQEEYAHRSGIDISFISRVERGLTQPSIGVLLQMARSLDTTGGEMIGELERTLAGK
jgi:transcriptional regulator with XRE-family HTH domain